MKNFNDGWLFRLDEGTWQPVDLPHDWLIFDTRNFYKSGVGEYKKTFEISGFSNEKSYKLRFDGVYMDTKIFVNENEIFEWKNGYTAFSFEIGEFLHEGENEVRVAVNYESPNSRWYSGAGIYRDVWFIEENHVHFKQDGINITPVLRNNEWTVYVEAEVENLTSDSFIYHEILDVDFAKEQDGGLKLRNPRLWDTNDPYTYTLKSTILKDGIIINEKLTRFGLRTIDFTPNEGFYLNGRQVKINGVCLHHDLGIFGAKVHRDALRRQLVILKDMGVNAIRTAHNPPAEVFMELTDEMGFLVMSEFTDMWKRPKTRYDYARFFDDWVEKDVAAWVRRDRNCPSLILWSIGNEVSDTHVSFEEGSKTMLFLMDLVKKHDPNRHAWVTLCSNYMPWENTKKCADIIKLMGYNYAEYLYDDHHKKHPDWIIYGAETSSVVASRGIYHFPLKRSTLANDDLQCSSLGNSATSWGAKSNLACIHDHERDFVFGQFLWSGFDYIGEPTPYHTKNSYFGQIDTAGFPKDSFYIFKAAWTSEPMVHLYPYWDFSPGQEVDVRVVSNAEEVELFLNGVSCGKKEVGKKLVADYVLNYEPGEIKAVAYISGKAAREMSRKSFGDTHNLRLTTTTVGALDFTEISAMDISGNPVENANDRVIVKVDGGILHGLDSGDSTDYENYQSNTKRLFSGRLLVISEGGAISAEVDTSDIPIRKIELSEKDLLVTAEVFPKSTTHPELTWRLTNEAGIDSPYANIKPSGNTAKIIPKADGEVYVRCLAKNGKEHPAMISLIKINLTGYGEPFLDPYSFISGGLYSISNVPMTNGNERGVATLRDGVSHVGYDDIDFGCFGSDEFTIGLFPLTHEPFDFEVWLGMPDTGRKLTTLHYDKGSKWNTYIDVTYKLPERIKGLVTISFLFNLKCHIKGFRFTKQNKAEAKLMFTEHDAIYGDSFTITDSSINEIGNNVTIEFYDMQFVHPASKLALSWRQVVDSNSVRIIFTDETGKETVNEIMLAKQEAFNLSEFALSKPIAGYGVLKFVFLPGTKVDLECFEFMHHC